MGLATRLAGLAFNAGKCALAPLWSECSVELVSLVREFLADQFPVWFDFVIADRVLYLGVWLGPGVSLV
eukprot:6531796-Pyramimonas_sp.AAC.1